MERPEATEITRIVKETDVVQTLFVKSAMMPKPGQFVMVWLPGLNEKPYAAGYIDSAKKEIGITVVPVGPFSSKLCSMKPGEKIGLRGPYGNGYTIDRGLKKIVMVGGGCGSASLTMLAEEVLKQGTNVRFILGARSGCNLIYAERLKKLLGSSLIVTTDDGSTGMKGFATDALRQLLQEEKVDKVFACGPEKMLKAVVGIGISAGIKGEISMERYMKCGFGVCGHCCVDPIGIRLCVEGPVIDFSTAAKITELGSYFRTKSSRKEKV